VNNEVKTVAIGFIRGGRHIIAHSSNFASCKPDAYVLQERRGDALQVVAAYGQLVHVKYGFRALRAVSARPDMKGPIVSVRQNTRGIEP
jgi:hypothetical protein